MQCTALFIGLLHHEGHLDDAHTFTLNLTAWKLVKIVQILTLFLHE